MHRTNFWHGDYFKTSPLFTFHKITIPGSNDAYMGQCVGYQYIDQDGQPTTGMGNSRPHHWPVVPLLQLKATSSAAYKRLKGCGESVRMQFQLLPLLLASWLDFSKFRTKWQEDLLSLHGTEHQSVVSTRNSIFAMSKAYSLVFALGMPNTLPAVTGLQNVVNTARRLMKSCWSGIRGISFAKTTNFHSAAHIGDTARRFGLARLVSCATGECLHGILRRATAHSNHQHIEKDMMTIHNVRQSLVFLLCGGLEHLHDVASVYSPDLLQSLRDDPTWKKLVQGSGSTQSYADKHQSERDELPPSADSPDVQLHASLGVVADTGHEHFRFATFPTREKFASRITIGEWYVAVGPDSSTSSMAYVRVESIYTDATSIFCHVHPLTSTGNVHSVTGLPIYEPTFSPIDIPITCVQRPAHIVPFCPVGSHCHVPPLAPQPHAFTFSCCGLRADHAPTSQYIVNTFFVK